MQRHHNTAILFTAAGTLCGYLIFHPYAMAVYLATHVHESGELHFHWRELASGTLAVFGPTMFTMSLPFAVFGAVIGLLLGIVVERTKKLEAEKYEHEKQKVALDTLKQLMVTMSHYLLNANMIIGGKVRHCRKATSDGDILAALDVVEENGRKIDAVISALRKVTEIKTAYYTTDGRVEMLDIAQEIENQIGRARALERDST